MNSPTEFFSHNLGLDLEFLVDVRGNGLKRSVILWQLERHVQAIQSKLGQDKFKKIFVTTRWKWPRRGTPLVGPHSCSLLSVARRAPNGFRASRANELMSKQTQRPLWNDCLIGLLKFAAQSRSALHHHIIISCIGSSSTSSRPRP